MIYRAKWQGAAASWALLSQDGRKTIAIGSANEVFHEAAALGATRLELLDGEGRLMLALAGVAADGAELLPPWSEDVPTSALWRAAAAAEG